jgi:DNA-binding MarR family transcriptional regulator
VSADPAGVTGGPEPVAADALAARLGLVLARLIRQLRRVGESDVPPGAMSVLFTLNRCGAVRLGDLAGREGIAPPTLSRIVAVLEEGGYLVRQVDPRDRRAAQVAVTERGARLVQGIGSARDAELRSRLVRLTPEHLEALVAALPALEALTEDRRPA